MTERSDTLHEELRRKKVQSDIFTRLAIVLCVLFLMMVLVTVVFLTFQAREQARQNGRLSTEVLKVSERLADCTTPGGKCYQDGQKRTAEAVRGINQGNLIAVAAVLDCRGRGHTTAPAILRCAEELVTQVASNRP